MKPLKARKKMKENKEEKEHTLNAKSRRHVRQKGIRGTLFSTLLLKIKLAHLYKKETLLLIV